MPRAARKQFSREFKVAALNRVQDGVRSMADVARELGVHPGTLRQWKKQLGAASERGATSAPRQPRAGAAGGGSEESLEAEVLRLRRELATLRQERDILKKAAAVFARDVP